MLFGRVALVRVAFISSLNYVSFLLTSMKFDIEAMNFEILDFEEFEKTHTRQVYSRSTAYIRVDFARLKFVRIIRSKSQSK